jgi:hypothetical protein
VDSLVVDTAIGLVFIFAVVSMAVSALTEAASRVIGLRGEYLLRGLRSLLDGGGTFELPWSDLLPKKDNNRRPDRPSTGTALVTKVMEQPVIARSADQAVDMPGKVGDTPLTNAQRRRLPSYLSARTFSRAFVDAVIPDDRGTTTLTTAKAAVEKLTDEPLRKHLLRLLEEANGDIATVRREMEEWYDDHMARVGGWYKRHVRWISLAVATVLVLLLNINAVQIARSLYSDQALRDSVVTKAVEGSDCGKLDPATCLGKVRDEIGVLGGSGLPVGWGTSPECVASTCSWGERLGLVEKGADVWQGLGTFLLMVLGWAIMAAASLPGARFWFDSLARLGSLRSTGPKPAITSASGSGSTA